MDQRLQMLRVCLDQLDDQELQRILEHPPGELLCDHGNYEPATGRFCPLAVAFRIPELLGQFQFQPSNALVDMLIGELGRRRRPDFIYNQMHGVPGEGYREDRAGDVRRACAELLQRRQSQVVLAQASS